VERGDADVAWDATARYRFRAVLVMAFAALALVLAMVGVFGVLAYSVERRVRDFGVRRALGATTGDVVRLVVGSAVRVIATGAAIGLALSMALGRVIDTMLFGVEPLVALTFASNGDGAGLHCCVVDCRPRLASHPHRSGGCPARQVIGYGALRRRISKNDCQFLPSLDRSPTSSHSPAGVNVILKRITPCGLRISHAHPSAVTASSRTPELPVASQVLNRYVFVSASYEITPRVV